jgi:L-aminopeptidase/D-esterase-like protein
MRFVRRLAIGVTVLATLAGAAIGGPAPRARDLGVPFEGTPGPLDAITDVPGVEVGQVSIIAGEGPLKVGQGPIRTGVTVILPRGGKTLSPVYGGSFDLNGNGEMTGQAYLQDFGTISGPIALSNTNAVGQVYAGVQAWTQARQPEAADPVVAETWDGRLNDIAGFHVTQQTAIDALDAARAGPVDEGDVGGGVGMICFGFKGGIGTASRRVSLTRGAYTIGVLVQCNTGDRTVLRIAGAPVGAALSNRWLPCFDAKLSPPDRQPKCAADGGPGPPPPDAGSIIIVVGADAPLTPTQLNRIAKRAAMGLARLGSYSGNGSGDLIVSFSTAAAAPNHPDQTSPSSIEQIPSVELDPLFQGVVEATEEAIVNALVASQTMTGADGYRVFALPHDELRDLLKRYGRLGAPAAPEPSSR